MKRLSGFIILWLAFSIVVAQNTGSERKRMDRETKRSLTLIDSMTKLDDLNNQSNHFYYYYYNNTGCYNVVPLDYKSSTVTLLAKATPPQYFENTCPYNLTSVGLTTDSVHSQKWENLIGLPWRNDYQGRILEHYDRGYLIAGNTASGNEGFQGWLIKTDINGQLLWDKPIISYSPDQLAIFKLLIDNYGNMYVFGFLLQDQPNEFPLIFKLNACGELQWCRLLAIDGYLSGFFLDAIFLENGDLLGLAYMPENDPSNNNRIIVFRISPEGELIWKKGYATHENHPYYGDPYGASIHQFGDIYMIVGNVYSPYPNSPNPYHVYQRPMFIGINEDFEEQWIIEFGINDSLLGQAETVVPINDTLFMGVGRHRFINENGELDQNAWLMFFNNTGVEAGNKILVDEQFGPEVLESGIFEVEQIEGDKYLLSAGYLNGEIDDYTKGDLVTDTAGNVYNYTIRENTSGGGSIYIAKTFDKKYVLDANYQLPNQTTSDIYLYKINENLEQDTVYPGNYTYDSLCKNLPIQSGVIDLGGCDVITAIGEIPTLEEYNQKLQTIPLTASPNPTNTGEVLLEMENTGLYDNLELKVFDVLGNQVHTQKIWPHQGAALLDVSAWARGIYVAAIFSHSEMKGKCKIVVE